VARSSTLPCLCVVPRRCSETGASDRPSGGRRCRFGRNQNAPPTLVVPTHCTGMARPVGAKDAPSPAFPIACKQKSRSRQSTTGGLPQGNESSREPAPGWPPGQTPATVPAHKRSSVLLRLLLRVAMQQPAAGQAVPILLVQLGRPVRRHRGGRFAWRRGSFSAGGRPTESPCFGREHAALSVFLSQVRRSVRCRRRMGGVELSAYDKPHCPAEEEN
jgi:hypothetical protein